MIPFRCAAVLALLILALPSISAAQEPCPQALRFDAAPGNDLDPGWTGIVHDNHFVGLTLTMGVSGCAGSTQGSCGTCSVSGPLANGGGAAFNNRRCVDALWVTCDTDSDCVTAGFTGPCHVFFGPPTPISGGGVTVCITDEITGPASGSTDIEAGSLTMSLPILTRIYTGATIAEPCPQCNAGVCDGGARNGMVCSVSATSPQFGNVSFDCPPGSSQIGFLSPSGLTLSTTPQSMTLSAANPTCRCAPP